MPGRTIAIGDIHGCSAALCALLDAISPQPHDKIVTLGDYVDRGPDVPGVIERLIGLSKECLLISILGNHDEMLLDIVGGDTWMAHDWLSFGGDATLTGYGCDIPSQIPKEHIRFLQECVPMFETPTHFFVHGSYLADLPLDEQPTKVLLWDSLRNRQPGPHRSGKIAVVGHTAQEDGRVLDLGYLQCIDTCCFGTGWLTALDVESGQIWQADKQGKLNVECEALGEG